ncbi:unnamed protein product [Sphenostylis stenocarpa]|uniref:Uncharacterized protein n=1 Tax=Sphenostylis stenocarpa TaxID=92480 RepID=A0AA86VUD8_9FABA|nr:unnamed protein product [Sphenostylis stenocarpa]
MARLVSLSGLELERSRIVLLSQFSYSQLSSAATKSVLLGFDLRLGIYLSYAHAKGKGSPKRGRRMNSSTVPLDKIPQYERYILTIKPELLQSLKVGALLTRDWSFVFCEGSPGTDDDSDVDSDASVKQELSSSSRPGPTAPAPTTSAAHLLKPATPQAPEPSALEQRMNSSWRMWSNARGLLERVKRSPTFDTQLNGNFVSTLQETNSIS